MTRNAEAIRRLFRVPHNRSFDFEPFDAVFPGRTAPVIRQLADCDRELSMMNWGFVLLPDGRAPKRVTSTRDDKARTSPFWRNSFETRRCLVLANSFCEPHDDIRPATWHWFALRGQEPRPLFAFAGLWTVCGARAEARSRRMDRR
jgi:putative SOS response-associated peptidase YedK